MPPANFRIRVDTAKCVSSGQCAAFAPELFDQNEDDGIVILLQENPPAALYQKAIEAADLCPVRAIIIEENP